jgi:hypothetical protein
MQINNLKKIGDLPLWITRIHHKTYLIDHGALCSKKNLYTNLDYTVIPEIIRHTGHPTIDTIIFCKPSNKMSKVAKQCATQLNCSTIMATPKANCYHQLQTDLKDSHISVIPLQAKRQATINLKNTF